MLPYCAISSGPDCLLRGLEAWGSPNMADLFDSALNLEEQHIQEGYDEGLR